MEAGRDGVEAWAVAVKDALGLTCCSPDQMHENAVYALERLVAEARRARECEERAERLGRSLLAADMRIDTLRQAVEAYALIVTGSTMRRGDEQ